MKGNFNNVSMFINMNSLCSRFGEAFIPLPVSPLFTQQCEFSFFESTLWGEKNEKSLFATVLSINIRHVYSYLD